jgi:regulator of sigma E protease
MTLIVPVLVLSLIVLVHELGHLASAKFFGVYCKEFAIGMGPKLFSKKGKETEYSIRAFPFGGFVAMAGEESVEAEVPPNRSLLGIAKWKRIIILLSGVAMNFILAFVLFLSINLAVGAVYQSPKPVIASVIANSPAEEAGLQANDTILKMTFTDGTSLVPETFDDVVTYVQLYHSTMILTVDRSGETLEITVTPVFNEETQRYYLGVNIPPGEMVKINGFEAVTYAFSTMLSTVFGMFVFIGKMLTGVGLTQVSGPIGIIDVTSTQASLGILNLTYLTALLSLNIGVFNLLPLPILDGGRVVLTLIEAIFRRPINKNIELALMYISAAALIGLMLFATWQDIGRLF